MAIRNVLLIGVDQMRSDVAGPGKAVPAMTPHLDRLYVESANFTRAYSSCPLCSPARASMFTGDYAFKHGMGTNCGMYYSLSTELIDPSQLLHYRLKEVGCTGQASSVNGMWERCAGLEISALMAWTLPRTATSLCWRAPLGWSGLIVGASWAFGLLARCFPARTGDIPMSCAA